MKKVFKTEGGTLMNYSNSYHTKQQQAILEYMENSTDGYVTVNQIAKHLKEQGRSVGTTTIYRHLDKFQKEGIVQKIVLDGNSGAYYQYIAGESGNKTASSCLNVRTVGKLLIWDAAICRNYICMYLKNIILM